MKTLFERMSEVARQGAIPPITNDDRLPHDRAVWREHHLPTSDQIAARLPVSIDRGGLIEQATADQVDWLNVSRWRFGWAPSPTGQPKGEEG
jgi:hypothetical protein